VKISVIGAGVMGLSAARALLQDGHQVTVYEQGSVPNPLASSADRSRLIRWPYGGMTGYMRMVGEAYDAWERVWDDIDARHYTETGTLMLDRSAGQWVEDSVSAMTGAGINLEHLAPELLRETYPYLDAAGARAAYLVPQGGVLHAAKIVEGLARFVAHRGGAIERERVVATLDPRRAELTLADGETVAADLVIVAVGPWTGRLLPEFAERLTPSRQIVAYLEPPSDLEDSWRTAPMLLDINDDGGAYVVPPALGAGPKIGDHTFSMTGETDRNRAVCDDEVRGLIDFARPLIANLDEYRVTEAKTCFYTMTADQRFIVEPHGKAWVMAGFSGHGFKFAAVLGEAVAGAISGRRDAADVTAWAAGRKAL